MATHQTSVCDAVVVVLLTKPTAVLLHIPRVHLPLAVLWTAVHLATAAPATTIQPLDLSVVVLLTMVLFVVVVPLKK